MQINLIKKKEDGGRFLQSRQYGFHHWLDDRNVPAGTSFLVECRGACTVKGRTLWNSGLSFKDRQVPVPNNRSQALQRANGLKRRETRSCLKITRSFLQDIKSNGYALVKCPLIRRASKERAWYIPHHGVHHPHKPEKIRVVFEFSAKFMGKPLTNTDVS